MPLINVLFEDLVGAEFFSNIDLTTWYNQLSVKEEGIPKMAFWTRYGSFKCLVINFGMTNSPSSFVTLINEDFKLLAGRCVVVFLGDIIVYSKTKQYHWRDLKTLHNHIEKEKLIDKPQKCQFTTQDLVFLGARCIQEQD